MAKHSASHSVVDYVILGLMAALLAAAALAFALAPSKALPKAAQSVQVECEIGSCWLRRAGSLFLEPLPLSKKRTAALGDEVLTLGTGSQLLALFSEGQGELRLADTSVARLTPGRAAVQAADAGQSGASNSMQEAPTKATTLSLVYAGEIAIDVVSPATGAPIMVNTFPAQLHLAFSVRAGTPTSSLAKLEKWTLLDVSQTGNLKRLSSFVVKHSADAQGSIKFFADFQVPQKGSYALLPEFLDAKEENLQFRFQLLGHEALEGEIKNLIKDFDQNPEGQIEIRDQ